MRMLLFIANVQVFLFYLKVLHSFHLFKECHIENSFTLNIFISILKYWVALSNVCVFKKLVELLHQKCIIKMYFYYVLL